MTLIYGHRGASAYAPENTMAAFKKAIEMGADGIETDVHLTKDGVLVLIHDETLDRTTNGTGWIKDLTYSEIQKVNASNGYKDEAFYPVPTLEELLTLAKEANIYLNIELKTDGVWYEGLEEKVWDMVKTYDMTRQVVFSSFNHYSLMKMKQLAPEMPYGLLYMEGLYEPWNYAKMVGMTALHPYYPSCYLPEFMEQSHQAGIKVRAWTINKEEDMRYMMAHQMDAIITNDVALAIKVRKDF